MESPQGSIAYIIHTTVIKVAASAGYWWVHFDGSWESLAFGPTEDPAPFAVGDCVKITFQKEPSECPASQPTTPPTS